MRSVQNGEKSKRITFDFCLKLEKDKEVTLLRRLAPTTLRAPLDIRRLSTFDRAHHTEESTVIGCVVTQSYCGRHIVVVFIVTISGSLEGPQISAKKL